MGWAGTCQAGSLSEPRAEAGPPAEQHTGAHTPGPWCVSSPRLPTHVCAPRTLGLHAQCTVHYIWVPHSFSGLGTASLTRGDEGTHMCGSSPGACSLGPIPWGQLPFRVRG